MDESYSARRFIFPLEHLYWQVSARTIEPDVARQAFEALDTQIRTRLDESERARLTRLSRAYRQLSRNA